MELELLLATMEDIKRLILEKRGDLGIMRNQEDLPLAISFHTLGGILLKIVCSPEHEIANKVAGWEDLRRYSQLIFVTRNEKKKNHVYRLPQICGGLTASG